MHQGTRCSSQDQQSFPQLPGDSSVQVWLSDTFHCFPSPLIAQAALGTCSAFSPLGQQSEILGRCEAPLALSHAQRGTLSHSKCASRTEARAERQKQISERWG